MHARTIKPWPLEPGSHRHLLCFRQTCRLSTLSSEPKMVVPASNALASSAYQAGALLLSYRTKLAEGASNALAPVEPVLFSRQVQPACICLPSAKVAARVGFAPTPNGLTGRRATIKHHLAFGTADRNCTCMDWFRRPMPDLFRPRQHVGNWSARQELHLRSLGPRPSALATTLRAGHPGHH